MGCSNLTVLFKRSGMFKLESIIKETWDVQT